MAIKISGSTIIDDSRVIVNADKIGIGTTNPHVSLEISSGDVGIGTTNPSAPVLNTNTSKLAVGILTANQIFGPVTGELNPTGSVIIDDDLTVNGNTTLGSASGDALTVNATPTFKENSTFEKNVSIGGTLTYEDVTNVDSVGLITARNGIHVLGVGVSVAGFSTFFNTVEFQDKVGIGTTNPLAPLQIDDDSPKIVLKDTDNNADISIHNVGGAAVYSSNGDTVFQTQDTNERFRINQDGKVGIGTDDPDYGLHVYGAGDILVEDSNNGSAHLRLRSSNNGSDVSNWKIKTGSNNYLFIENDTVGGTSQFTIDNSGNVGIGSAIPAVNGIDLIGPSSGNGEIKVSRDGGASILTQAQDSLGRFGTNSNHNLQLMVNSSGVVNITTGGEVGVGLTNPTAKLHVNGTSNGLQARFGGTETGLGVSCGQKTNDNALVKLIAQDSTYGTLVFETAGSERLRITSDGNVGIGTINPQQKLDVVGGNIRVGKTSNGQFIGENNSGAQKIKLDTDGVSFLDGGNVGIGTQIPTDAVTSINTAVLAVGIVTAN